MASRQTNNSEFLQAALLYASIGWRVFPLRPKSKDPATKHGFKDATTDEAQIREWWEKEPNCNIGVATGKGLCVVDVDDKPKNAVQGSDMLRDWELEHGDISETVTAISGTGGVHYYYRVKDKVPCCQSDTIFIDLRCEGGYIVAPPSVHPVTGTPYMWDVSPEDMEPTEVTATDKAFIDWVYANRKGAETESRGFIAPDVIHEGEGRDNVLYKMACSMRARNIPESTIEAALLDYNEKYCKPPMPKRIVRQKVKSAMKHKPGLSEEVKKQKESREDTLKRWPYLTDNGKLKHNVFGRMLIERDRACIVDGAPAIWDGERYAVGWDSIDRAMVRERDQIKATEQKEVRHYIQLSAPQLQSSPPSLVAFRNCVVNIETNEVLPYTSDMVITNIIPHDFDKDASCPEVDKVLERMACGDSSTIMNLWQVIGLCMYRSSEFAVCPVLLGSGANGKSTFIKMLRAVLGKDNVSSLDLNVIGKQFQASRLAGKLANLGDDISNEFTKGDTLAVFKKVTSGDWIYTDVKGGDGYEFQPFCTLVFSANEMPKLEDSSEGMMRRLFPIEFNAVFTKDDPNYDPRIVQKVTSETACQRLCALGIIGLQSVIAGNGMKPNATSERMVEDIREDNDTVLQWVRDENIMESDIADAIISEKFTEYTLWCAGAKVYPVGRSKFTRRINFLYQTESVPSKTTIDGKQKRIFRKKA